jgi:hypothetical protein
MSDNEWFTRFSTQKFFAPARRMRNESCEWPE